MGKPRTYSCWDTSVKIQEAGHGLGVYGNTYEVFPGGGYKVLAIDLEGTEVCDYLTARGITCILLKYRVPDSGPHWEASLKRHVTPPAPLALQDAQRTLRLVRFHAARWRRPRVWPMLLHERTRTVFARAAHCAKRQRGSRFQIRCSGRCGTGW